MVYGGDRAGRPTIWKFSVGTATERRGYKGENDSAGSEIGANLLEHSSETGGREKGYFCETNPNLAKPAWKFPKNEAKNEPILGAPRWLKGANY